MSIQRGRGANGAAYNRITKTSMRKEDNQRLTIVETWQCLEANVLSNIPNIGTAHANYPTTYLTGTIPIEISAGQATYVLTYQGFDSYGTGTGTPSTNPADIVPKLWWDGSEARLPITYLNKSASPDNLTFARLVANVQAGGFNPLDSNDRFVAFPSGSTSDSYPMEGITDYYDVAGVWNRQYFSATVPDPAEWLKIETPPGSYPDISADTEWLRLVDSYDLLATGLFFVHQRWIPSQGIHGWCRGIYIEA